MRGVISEDGDNGRYQAQVQGTVHKAVKHHLFLWREPGSGQRYYDATPEVRALEPRRYGGGVLERAVVVLVREGLPMGIRNSTAYYTRQSARVQAPMSLRQARAPRPRRVGCAGVVRRDA